MFHPPRLGVGVVYNSLLHEWIEREPALVDLVEIEPETFWIQLAPGRWEFRLAPKIMERLATLPCPRLLHSIGFPVGGSRPPDLAHVPLLNRMADELAVPWVSEHLSFNSFETEQGILPAGMLLPPLQTEEGIACAIESIATYARVANRPLAVETAVNYLAPQPFEMSDGAFIREVVTRADCGILLDLHNLWANEKNGRDKARDVIADLPLDRVWEVHVAGGEERRGYWIDGHCGALPAEVRELAREVLPALANLGAVTLEVFPSHMPAMGPEGLARELDALREIWSGPARKFGHRAAQPRQAAAAAPAVQAWERALGDAILRRAPASAFAARLAADPALPLYSELLEEFRASMISTALGMTTRLLLLHLGAAGTRELLGQFWRRATPEMSASAEALRFAEFIRAQKPAIPLLQQILSFETAAILAIVEQQPQRVMLDCDIRPAIGDLLEHRLPGEPGPIPFEFVLEPPAEGGSRTPHAPNLS